MKYQNLLLSFSLAAAVSFGATLCAQAKMTPEQQKKAAAEAKAKADREARQKAFEEYRAIYNEAMKLSRENQYSKIAPLCEKMLVSFDKIAKFGPISQNELRGFEAIAHIYRWQWKNFKNETKHFYEEIIKRGDGDVAVGWIEMYAQFLKEQRMMKAEEIAKVLETRYKVKNISEPRLIRLLISDGKLTEADAKIVKLVAAEKEPEKKIGVYRQFLNNFKDKRVYGAQFANKYYKELMKLTTEPNSKCRLMGEYANFAEQFAFLSMDEVDKLKADRRKIPGLSKEMQLDLLCGDIHNVMLPEEAQAVVEKAMAAAGDDVKMRTKVLSACQSAFLGREAYVRMRDVAWFHSFWEKNIIALPPILGYHVYSGFLSSYLSDMATTDKLGDVEKMFQRFVASSLKHKKAAAADYAKKLAEKKALDKKLTDLKLGIDELNKQIREEKDNAKRAAMEKRIKNMREDYNATNASCGAAGRTAGAAYDALNKHNEHLSISYNMLSECYLKLGRRYMESTDPVFLRKAIAVQKQRIANVDSVYDKMASYSRIMNFAIEAEDYALARQIYAEAKVYAEKEIAKLDPRHKHPIDRIRGSVDIMKYPLAFISYYEEDYAKAIELLLPLTENTHRDYVGRVYEFIVRAYVAQGEYANALKFTDKMVDNAPWYMKNRFKQMISEMKERMAEAK